ncbi:MAG: UDP-N-acetylmuramate dehydrogenase [Lachnospiraceae bacterium]|nr:UDP-N-acetylmuramate dehydrogenase [Lachnospiraceae bacterium]
MTGKEIAAILAEHLDERYIHPDSPMSDCCSFRTGGNALCIVEVHNVEELRKVLTCVRKKFLPYSILGNGTNILVEDEGYSGVCIMLQGEFTKVDVTGYEVTAGGGASLAAAGRMAADMWLTGMEWACGIPGTIGGSIKMNAGAFGSEMSTIVKRVKALTTAGEEVFLRPYECHFGYRTSLFCEKKYIVLEAVFELRKGDKNEINATIEKYAKERRDKQPLDLPSAGCIFKNPKDNFAAKLIEEAGLGGAHEGGAMVSKKHHGFIVNTGNATAADIINLMNRVRNEVYKNSGVRLEPELVVLGRPGRY